MQYISKPVTVRVIVLQLRFSQYDSISVVFICYYSFVIFYFTDVSKQVNASSQNVQ